MGVTTKINVERFRLESWHIENFIDLIMDMKAAGDKRHPLVVFLADLLQLDETIVDDAFVHYEAFGKWSKMDSSRFITHSEKGTNWWWELYQAYKVERSHNKMLEILCKEL